MPEPDHAANQESSPLRFGIIYDGNALEDWQMECLRHVLNTGCALFELAIAVDGHMSGPQTGFHKNFLFDLYLRRLVMTSALRPVPPDALRPAQEKLHCRATGPDGLYMHFSEDSVGDIRLQGLDFILNFSHVPVAGDMLKAIRYGIWSYSHGGPGNAGQFPACLWEVMAGEDLAVVTLEKSTGRADTGVILRSGVFKADKSPLADNISSVYLECARWPARVCVDIVDGRAGYVDGTPSKRNIPPSVPPDDFHGSVLMYRILFNYLKHLANKYLVHEDWNVGIAYRPIHAFLTSDTTPEVYWLPHPKNRFWADPFGVMRNGELHVICEDFDYKRIKGSISAIKLSPKASSGLKTIIDSAVHMSYPFVLESGGEVYCIPETSRAGEICLYKALDFPEKWARVSRMVGNFKGADPTIFQYNGLWWLFCTDKQYSGMLNLYIWYSRDLFGPWQPHKLNPVKTDVRSARPAGTPFAYNGELYRPSQDCSKTYGGRVVINRILKLTTTEFEEEPVKAVEPYRNSIYRDGIHTISACGDMTLVDGKRNTVDPLILKNTLVNYSIKFINKYLLKARSRHGMDDRRAG